jgi:hypothetical protein
MTPSSECMEPPEIRGGSDFDFVQWKFTGNSAGQLRARLRRLRARIQVEAQGGLANRRPLSGYQDSSIQNTAYSLRSGHRGQSMNVFRKLMSTFAAVAFLSGGGCARKEVPKPSMNDTKSSWTSQQPAPAIATLPAPQAQAVPVAAPVQRAATAERNDSVSWDAAVPGSMEAFTQAVERCNALQGNEYTVCKNKADSELASR